MIGHYFPKIDPLDTRLSACQKTIMSRAQHLIPLETIERRIYVIRDHKVMMDRDVAELYCVKAIALRQQVKRNIGRFPKDFMFQLHDEEVDALVSQNVIPSRSVLGGALPYVFTQGWCFKSGDGDSYSFDLQDFISIYIHV